MKQLAFLVINLLLLNQAIAFSDNSIFKLTVEEKRIDSASKSLPDKIDLLTQHSQLLTKEWPKVKSFNTAKDLVFTLGNNLWTDAKHLITTNNNYDDRPLYWERLKLSKILRTTKPAFPITQDQLSILLTLLEESSRGLTNLYYKNTTHKKILLTGFDPFLLDKNIQQSNPSGVTALLLDGIIIEHKGITAEIKTFMVPVRYSDFDQGFVEKHLSPFYALNSVDMITTVSMGRKNFDLERFPGKRRSAQTPGNLNIYSGGSKKSPVISKLYNRPLPGPEYVEFSLPVKLMQQAKGKYKINDNHKVTTLDKTFHPKTLTELSDAIAVEGSGGGYLSNEISYRSIRLKNELESSIPTGHIHTPKIKKFNPKELEVIVNQIKKMLELSLPAL